MPIAVFTKSFQDRSIEQVCRIFRKLGVDGLDLTVRPGGHIHPKDAEELLPQAVLAAHHQNLRVLMLTTSITQADRAAEKLLTAAAKEGITRVKLGYYRYPGFGQLRRRMDEVKRHLERIARMARPLGVLPCVHIHSGPYIPSHGTMLYELLRDFEPGELGAYVDTLHMALEGGGAGWRQGLDLLAPWIALVAVKNFRWETGRRDRHGQLRWHTRNCPLADGVSPIPDFVACLRQLGYRGIYSLHSEYKGSHSFRNLDTEGCIRQTAEDLKFFRPLVESGTPR